MSADRYDGVTQQSYTALNPDTYPLVPSTAALAAFKVPQQLQILYSDIVAARNYQWTAGVERQVNKYVRFSANDMGSPGVHLSR